MINARIYQQLKNAMQSGRAGTDSWIIEFDSTDAQRPDPLMGWAGSGDTRRQLRLKFATQEAAEAYAARNGLITHVIPPQQKQLKLQAYADNFR